MLFGLTFSFLASQFFASIAIVSDILSFQFKERKKILLFFMISAACLGMHYFLLGRMAPAVMTIAAVIRLFVAYHKTGWFWTLFFSVIFSIITYIFYTDVYDLVILTGIILFTVSAFQKDDKNLRLVMVGAVLCYILYNFLIFSPVGMLLEIIFLSSNLIGYYRYYIKKTSERQSETTISKLKQKKK